MIYHSVVLYIFLFLGFPEHLGFVDLHLSSNLYSDLCFFRYFCFVLYSFITFRNSNCTYILLYLVVQISVHFFSDIFLSVFSFGYFFIAMCSHLTIFFFSGISHLLLILFNIFISSILNSSIMSMKNCHFYLCLNPSMVNHGKLVLW